MDCLGITPSKVQNFQDSSPIFIERSTWKDRTARWGFRREPVYYTAYLQVLIIIFHQLRARCNRGTSRNGLTMCRAACNKIETAYHAISSVSEPIAWQRMQCSCSQHGTSRIHCGLLAPTHNVSWTKETRSFVFQTRKPDLLAFISDRKSENTRTSPRGRGWSVQNLMLRRFVTCQSSHSALKDCGVWELTLNLD